MSMLHDPGKMNTALPAYLPLCPEDKLDEFRLDGSMAARSMLRELMTSRAHVVLHARADGQLHLMTRIEALEGEHFILAVEGDPAQYDPVLEADGLTLVGNTGAVRIQLDIERVALRDDQGQQQLVARIPGHGWRIQRRNDFRIVPPEVDDARVFFRTGSAGEASGSLHDLSAGGLCFFWPADIEPPRAGALLRHCRIERNRAAALPCDLKVIRISPGEQPGQLLISSRFEGLPDSVSRQIQIYVMDVERRTRAASRMPC